MRFCTALGSKRRKLWLQIKRPSHLEDCRRTSWDFAFLTGGERRVKLRAKAERCATHAFCPFLYLRLYPLRRTMLSKVVTVLAIEPTQTNIVRPPPLYFLSLALALRLQWPNAFCTVAKPFSSWHLKAVLNTHRKRHSEELPVLGCDEAPQLRDDART